MTAEITARKAEVERVKGMGLKWQQKFKELQGTTASANAGIAEKEAQITALRAEVEEKANKVSEVEKKLADAEQAGQLKDGTITKLQVELAKAGEAGEAAAVPAADPTDQAQLVSGCDDADVRPHSRLSVTRCKNASPRRSRISLLPRRLPPLHRLHLRPTRISRPS